MFSPTPMRVIDTDDGLFAIGADGTGRLLELLARPAETGDDVIVSPQPLRAANARRYLQ
jgi:hypothetical protein